MPWEIFVYRRMVPNPPFFASYRCACGDTLDKKYGIQSRRRVLYSVSLPNLSMALKRKFIPEEAWKIIELIHRYFAYCFQIRHPLFKRDCYDMTRKEMQRSTAPF